MTFKRDCLGYHLNGKTRSLRVCLRMHDASVSLSEKGFELYGILNFVSLYEPVSRSLSRLHTPAKFC